MPEIRTPSLTSYGNTFSRINYGNSIDEVKKRGEIDTDKLNKNNLTDEVQTTTFEKQCKDFILASLGHPIIRVELSDFQLKVAIDQAVTRFSYHCPLWTKQFAVLTAVAHVGVYEIPKFILENLEYVVYKKALLSVAGQTGTMESDFFIKYFQDNFLFSDFSVGDFYLMQAHLETLKKVLGNDGTWDVINGQYLQLHPTPSTDEDVILEYRALDTNTMLPAYRSWIQRYATAICKGILGRVLGKLKTFPAPGGGVVLDGPELRQESKEEMQKLEAELFDEIEEVPFIQWG